MTYTLVGMSALGFDLVRLPGGARAAAVLRTAVTASADELDALARQHPGSEARGSWLGDDVVPTGRTRTVDELSGTGTGTLQRLETSLLGDARALERFLRHDALVRTWVRSGDLAVQDPTVTEAADVLVDAAVACYLEESLPVPRRRAMVAPLLRSDVPVRDHTAPVGLPVVDEVLAALAAGDDAARTAWRDAVDRQRARTTTWAPAMHRATWVLAVTDRLRSAADAQLAAAIAFRRAGLTARDAAYGVWNAVSGTVQALTAVDLLDEADAEVLLGAWQEVRRASS
ncbi:hypothetical protein [Nocardioides deserti]|uniref:ADP-ribosylglycohydrolase family protein n=1 Tax=Nocardioides deserti TaxID=1588644 RepID=A0ABR6UDC2_9ACTN|nr:hypothetical protein [Nocardioides deserti]MBC2962444.1 hypothetical protein [Nocardioides deserti]GGO78038.1 hypothetical protein GCM10012276_34560 [Nocardioides deserti]